VIRRARNRRIAAVLASAALFAPIGPLTTPAAAQSARQRADTVAVTVDDVTPTTPLPTSSLSPLTVTLTVTNQTDQNLQNVRIDGERGEPIGSQAALDQAMQQVPPPAGHVIEVKPTTPIRLDLPAGASQQVTFRTTTSLQVDHGLCICAEAAVYPLYFSAHTLGPGQVDQRLGVAGTFVPSFFSAPAPVRVSWVWPLIDQPHRLTTTDPTTGEPLFTDDALAGSVGSGGRLDRALAVVESVGSQVPLTLVSDPELLAELQVMATKPYRVVAGQGRTIPGAGAEAAARWLARLRNVLTADPLLRVQLTPYADPDVESLNHDALTWSAALPTDVQPEVATALGGHTAAQTLAWPAGGALSRATLDKLVGQGVSTLLLNSSAMAPKPAAGTVRPGLATLSARNQDVRVGLLDPALERYATQAVTLGDKGTAALPSLVAELAVRAAQQPAADHVAVLAPPRWVDPDVEAAVRVVKETSSSLFTRPASLGDAVGGAPLPGGPKRLAAVPASARTLPEGNLDAAAQVAADLPAFRSLLTPARGQTIDPQAAALLHSLPAEAQRVASSAWGRTGSRDAAAQFAGELTRQLDNLAHGVFIRASFGSYTLASDNSPLPITVENNLNYPVTVTVDVGTVGGLPGFSAKSQTDTVEAHSKRTLHVVTNIARPGRIRVEATLFTPNGTALGTPVAMTVRSTALGVVGVVITIGAGAVLLLALLIRFGRRLRHRRRGGPRRPRWDPDAPEAAREFAPTPATAPAPAESSQ
jgi:hypothetical protein